MTPIAEVGGFLAVGVAITTLLQKFGSVLRKWHDRACERWYRRWTRPGNDGDEHYGVMFDRHMKEARKR